MTATMLPEKKSYTNSDIMDAVRELHGCVHAVDEKVRSVEKEVANVRQHNASDIAKLHKLNADMVRQVAEMRGAVSIISQSMGIKPSRANRPAKPVKRFGSQHPWTVVFQMFGAVTGALALAKVFGPPAAAFLTSVWTAILHS
ncbi:MAG: hypothetical protein WA840_01090 [Caulobacteraceae bacterium]